MDAPLRQTAGLAPPGDEAEPRWWLPLFAAGVLLLHIVGADFGRFYEGDDISIAAGIAALVRDAAGDTYRYGVQVGYYHLLAWLSALSGGRLMSIPDLMTWVSVIAGAMIPVVATRAFRRDLSRGERWMAGALLVANPVVWQSSQYGNTATLSVALTLATIAILSNRPGVLGEGIAMALLAAAILVRADAVLASGAVFVILWRTHRAFVRAAAPLVLCGATVAATLAALLLLDPRMDGVLQSVAEHAQNPITTRFATFLLYGMSPVPLLMAAAGARDLQRSRGWILAILGAWIVPFVAFYFTNTTTPRYLMQLMPPLCMAAAVGTLGSLASEGWARLATRVVVIPLTFAHLLVGLGEFSPATRRGWLTESMISSDDGPAWTGALLYKTFVRRPDRGRATLRLRHFAPWNEVERSLLQGFDSLATGSRRGRRVTIVTAAGTGNELHFFAQVAGVHFRDAMPGPEFGRRWHLEHGGTSLTTVGMYHLQATHTPVPVAAGDELWGIFDSRGAADSLLLPALPPGLTARPLPDWPGALRLWRYSIERGP